MYDNNTPQIQSYYQLSAEQQNAVTTLLSESVSHDGYFYDAELETPGVLPPFPIFYLLYEKNMLAGFLSFSLFSVTEKDFDVFIYAFIHPNCRKKGFFSQLLEISTLQLKNAKNRVNSIYFPINKQSAVWIFEKMNSHSAFLYDYSEYIMKKQLSFSNNFHSAIESDIELEYDENEYGMEYSLWKVDDYIGGCLIAPIRTNEAMIYEFGIIDQEQGHGYGKTGLYLICNDLYQKSYTTVSLQVSGKNKIAHSLYLNCGFQITEEIRYFRFILF